MTIPTSITAGDTYSQRVDLAEYPASAGWVLKERLIPRAGGPVVEITGTADGDTHVLAAAAAATAAWVPGDYGVARWAEKAGESHVVEQGQTAIAPDPRTMLGATDTRSQAEIALAAAKAARDAWNPTQRRYRIGDREMEFNSPGAIAEHISKLEAEVKREQAAQAMAAGRPNPRKLLVRMGRA